MSVFRNAPGLARAWPAIWVTLVLGVAAGVGGILLSGLLHGIQHLAFGYSPGQILGHESFLQGVSAAPPARRFLALTACGLVAGCGWWALFRFGRPLVSIKQALASADHRMPVVSTLAHVLLQIVTVALGSPLGREVAPRELGALCAGWLSARAGLDAERTRVMVACGAGAGLAAVYNVPLAGALFTMEVLLGTYAWSAAAPAMVTAALAAGVSWIGLGHVHQYTLPPLRFDLSLAVWALPVGPLFGLAAWRFSDTAKRVAARAPRDGRLPLVALGNFMLIGALVMVFPQLPGNGKSLATLSFDSQLTIALALVLLALKVLITLSSLRVGAAGGLLTPALANGALMGVALGGVWSLFWPGAAPGAYAVVGATAFLASSMQMPLTAVVLVWEMTQVGHDLLVPIGLAVAGSILTFRWCVDRHKSGPAVR